MLLRSLSPFVSYKKIVNKREITFKSGITITKHGVPQQGISGPLFFIIYVNDFPLSTRYPMTMFADDSSLDLHKGDIYTLKSQIM